MTYIIKKVVKGKEYYYVVEGKKDKNGKVKQKIVYYIGNREKLLKFHEMIKKFL